MPVCSKCHRPLTDPYSIAVGMGPECRGGAAKKGWKFPKAKWKVSGGRMIFDGVVGKVTPPPPPTTHCVRVRCPQIEEHNLERGAKKEEKYELVRRFLRNGGHVDDAVNALLDYMVEKDSRVTRQWCRKFVQCVIDKMNEEAERELKNKGS